MQDLRKLTNKEKKENKALAIERAIEIINSYNISITIRQWYYQMVSYNYIEKTQKAYRRFDHYTVQLRENGIVDPSKIIDRTREILGDIYVKYKSWQSIMKKKIDDIINPPTIKTSTNIFQEKIPIFMLEKQALQGFFEDVLGDKGMYIITATKGQQSATKIYELADVLKDDPREVHLFLFSDYDKAGKDIQNSYIERLKKAGVTIDSEERIALTLEQIKKYKLPYNPNKKIWYDSKGNEADGEVELDSLDPQILMDLIQKCWESCYNKEMYNQILKYRKIQQRRLNKHYNKQLKEFAKQILGDDSNG